MGHSRTALRRRFEDWLILLLSHLLRHGGAAARSQPCTLSPAPSAAALASAGHPPATWTCGRLSKHFIAGISSCLISSNTRREDFLPSQPVLLLHPVSESCPLLGHTLKKTVLVSPHRVTLGTRTFICSNDSSFEIQNVPGLKHPFPTPASR